MNGLLEKSLNRLQASGGQMTPQRRMILETLAAMQDRPSPDELYEMVRLQDPALHRSTVYRTLRWLEEEGIVRARFFDQAQGGEGRDPGNPDEHYHFLCTGCGRVIEFDTLLVNAIKAQFELHSGADVESGSVILYGSCAGCQGKKTHAQ